MALGHDVCHSNRKQTNTPSILSSRFKMSKIDQLCLFKISQAWVGTLYHPGISRGREREAPAGVVEDVALE